jgi:alpha-N-acetylglucosamine transferase
MQTLHTNKKTLTLAFLFIALCALLSSFYINRIQKTYVTEVRAQIQKQQQTLQTLSKFASTDTADATTEIAITDCSPLHRDRFDTLLSKLATLRGAELTEVENLFNECGSFYPMRTAVMVSKLEREFEVYSEYVKLLSLADTKTDTTTFSLEYWKSIVALHTQKSNLSLRLVSVQGRIISALIERTPIQSESMQALLREGQDTKDSLLVVSKQITDAEAKLQGL